MIAWLLDAGQTSEMRFTRGVALLINDSDMARRAAAQIPHRGPLRAPGQTATAEYEPLNSRTLSASDSSTEHSYPAYSDERQLIGER